MKLPNPLRHSLVALGLLTGTEAAFAAGVDFSYEDNRSEYVNNGVVRAEQNFRGSGTGRNGAGVGFVNQSNAINTEIQINRIRAVNNGVVEAIQNHTGTGFASNCASVAGCNQ